jgi:hypothetical protein
MVAKVFPADHPRAGEPTHFKEQILDGVKIHTIRKNFNYWNYRIEKVQSGQAVISLRQWEGRPYHSNQVEFKQLTEASIQKFRMGISKIFIDNKLADVSNEIIARNDGLDLSNFYHWFKVGKQTITDAGIIHFTDFRYNG